MPASSEKLTIARKEEIVDACAQLYETVPYGKITIGMIGEKTSFTRTSIYNYFRTKEEIFLALLEREYAAWADELEELAAADAAPEEFPARFAALLGRRSCMLKLLAMNLYDMEAGSSPENLVGFKKAYKRAMEATERCLRRHFAFLTEEDARQFSYAFFPFLFGVYPYTEVTDKQAEAMKTAGVPYRPYTAAKLTEAFVGKLIDGFRYDRA